MKAVSLGIIVNLRLDGYDIGRDAFKKVIGYWRKSINDINKFESEIMILDVNYVGDICDNWPAPINITVLARNPTV